MTFESIKMNYIVVPIYKTREKRIFDFGARLIFSFHSSIIKTSLEICLVLPKERIVTLKVAEPLVIHPKSKNVCGFCFSV